MRETRWAVGTSFRSLLPQPAWPFCSTPDQSQRPLEEHGLAWPDSAWNEGPCVFMPSPGTVRVCPCEETLINGSLALPDDGRHGM